MLKPWIIFSFIAGLSNVSFASSINSDFSTENAAPQIQFNLSQVVAGQGEQLVLAYLKAHAAEYGLAADLSNIRARGVTYSLLGSHYAFQQTHRGFDVSTGEIVVSLDKSGQNVRMVFNHIITQPLPDISVDAIISSAEAYDIAWRDLQVRGDLTADPAQRLVYYVDGTQAYLAYDMQLRVEAPYGSWQYIVNATDGAILSKVDTLIYRQPKVRTAPDLNIPLRDRAQEFSTFANRPVVTKTTTPERIDGTALVFDPDPRSFLANDDLQDNSPAEAFADAYVQRPLRDLAHEFDGIIRLDGRWVRVVDFDSPRTAPSISLDGEWVAKRGDNAFNDAMTYFHIDQSQRYMQSLGFIGDTGIQYAAMAVDTDGVQGQDNSYFSPRDNHLAFGHGCVDDNEDADVILHEYGHGIQWSINNNWSGGDTGAMGEGFGDYWAGSYSISTPSGKTFNPELVFSWDGHGKGNKCWSGRVLNAHKAKYDPKRTYSAHTSIPGGFQSDELWSTPLFQTLLAAEAVGINREEIDQIILQSHFGLGYGVKMRQMAEVTVQTAKDLFPDGAHAAIFEEKFKVHDILPNATP